MSVRVSRQIAIGQLLTPHLCGFRPHQPLKQGFLCFADFKFPDNIMMVTPIAQTTVWR